MGAKPYRQWVMVRYFADTLLGGHQRLARSSRIHRNRGRGICRPGAQLVVPGLIGMFIAVDCVRLGGERVAKIVGMAGQQLGQPGGINVQLPLLFERVPPLDELFDTLPIGMRNDELFTRWLQLRGPVEVGYHGLKMVEHARADGGHGRGASELHRLAGRLTQHPPERLRADRSNETQG
ncbi:MAG: hypothetical protein ACRDTE_32340 [Pseudonocardiaceae bacterium]